MLIGKDGKNNECLEKVCYADEPNIIEAADLLYRVLDASYACSGTCLKQEVNGHKENITSLYWGCKELMEQTAKGGGKTIFLAMSVLEQTFERALPLLLVRLEDIANGDMSQVEAVLRLKQIFEENPYKELWRKKAEKYRELIEKLGFHAQAGDYVDLMAIMDPLLDAFTFYAGRNSRIPPAIHKVRDGRRSLKRPYIVRSVCKYGSEKELVDTAARCGEESVIMFGAVEKINRQMEDKFWEWYYGRKSERMRNTMYHEHISEEEYLDQVCGYSRCVYLCVKSGEAIWLVRMPYDKDSYAGNEYGPENKYYAGRRAGYAPYEVFYKEPPAPESDTTFLSVRKKGWQLAELMDEQQKAWFPAFIEETIEKFFSEEEPVADTWILPEEMVAVVPEGMSMDKAEPGKNCIVPVISGLPAIPGYVHSIKTPEEIFQEKEMQGLLKYFHITEQDIMDAPVLPVKCGTGKETAEHTEGNIRKAYLNILAEKIAVFLEKKWDARRMVLDRINEDTWRIFENAAEGKFSRFMEVVVDGTEKTGRDGKPIVIRTSIEDCRESRPVRDSWKPRVLWAGDALSRKAPVVWKIRPRDAAEYATLLCIPKEELPDIMKLSGLISWFYEAYNHVLRDSLTNKYAGMHPCHGAQGENNRSIYLPPMADVNICMGKKIYNKYKGKLESAGERK